MKKIVLTLFCILGIQMYGQKRIEKEIDSILNSDFIILDSDTATVNIKEVAILKKLKFKTSKERRYYVWFRKKVHNAYPYAKIATEKYEALMVRLEKIESPQKKARYTKRIQKYLEKKFTDPLKKLTRTEGRILIKLIYRQTGSSAYEIVKEVRSGWKAFWYNTTANMFDLSLKEVYNPNEIKEDFLIEDILQRAFINATLDDLPPKEPIDFLEISANWKKKE